MNAINAIIKELSNISKKEAIERLHNLYSVSDDKKSRIKILELLNELKDISHFKEIENYFLSDEEPLVRIEAAKLLAFNYVNQEAKSIKPLIWVLENEKKSDIQYVALQLLVPLALQNEYHTTIIEALKKALKSNDNKLKMDAAEALDFLKEKSAVEDLFAIIDSSDIQVRVKIIKALGNFKYKKAIPNLIDNLGLDTEYVWNFTFDALKKILNKQELVDLLIYYLENPINMNSKLNKSYLKRGIIKALGCLGDKKPLSLLIKALKDENYEVYLQAKDAMDKIEPQWREKFRYELKRKNINII